MCVITLLHLIGHLVRLCEMCQVILCVKRVYEAKVIYSNVAASGLNA